MKNIDSLSKKTTGPDYKKVKKWGIIGGACLCAFALMIGFFVIKGNHNTLAVWTPEELGVETEECVEHIMLDAESVVIELNGAKTLNAVVVPSKFQKDLVWKSSDMTVATVKNGTVRAISPGIVAISAESTDGSCIAKCQVIIQKTAEQGTYEINEKRLVLSPHEAAALEIYKMPEKSFDSTVIWSSSNEKVATVKPNGQVIAEDFGTCVISAKSRETKTVIATCTVSVTASIDSVTLNEATMTLSEGATITLVPTLKPDNAANKSVTWESTNTAVATVDKAGKVTAKKAGTAVITCTTVDGEKKATCAITVQAGVEKIILNEESVILGIDEKHNLSATVWPETIADKTLVWTSSDKTVVSVDERGAILAIGFGRATITVSPKANPSVTDTCDVLVTRSTTGIELDKTTASVAAGKTIQLTAKVLPANAHDKKVTWSSDNTAVATVSSTGVVTGVRAGSTIVRCKASDGGFEANCKVTVYTEAEDLYFNLNSIAVEWGTTYDGDVFYVVTPDSAKSSVTCFSNDSSIANVTDNGGQITIKGVSLGETKLVARTKDGTDKEFSIPIYVNPVGYSAFDFDTNGDGTLRITGLKQNWQEILTTSSITVPGIIDGKKVTSVASNAFNGKLPGVTSVLVSHNIEDIGTGAFANNSDLVSVVLPKTLLVINSGAFENTGLANVTIPDSVLAIGDSAFKNSKMASVILGAGVKTIGTRAFESSALTGNLTIPSSVTTISDYAFYNTGISSVTFNTRSLKEIGKYSFAMTGLTKVVLPDGVTKIKECAFYGIPHLKFVTMPDSVTAIEKNAFGSCSNLSTIWMSEGIKTFDNTGLINTCTVAVTGEAPKAVVTAAGIDGTRIVAKTNMLYLAMTQ